MDKDRLKRVHVVTVRHTKAMDYIVVLSSGEEIAWSTWIKMSDGERKSL